MNITKFTEQKRTILIDNKNVIKPQLIYLPPLVFIEHDSEIYVVYEYKDNLYLLDEFIPNIQNGACICFGEHMEPSINNFWNSFFDDDVSARILSKPNWWKIKSRKRQKAYGDLLEIHHFEFLKTIIHLAPQEAINNLANNTDNYDIFKLILEYKPENIDFEFLVFKNKKIIQTFISYVKRNYSKEMIKETFVNIAQISIEKGKNEIFYKFEKYLNKNDYAICFENAATVNNEELLDYIFKYIENNNIRLKKSTINHCTTKFVLWENIPYLKKILKLKPSEKLLKTIKHRSGKINLLIRKALEQM